MSRMQQQAPAAEVLKQADPQQDFGAVSAPSSASLGSAHAEHAVGPESAFELSFVPENDPVSTALGAMTALPKDVTTNAIAFAGMARTGNFNALLTKPGELALAA